VSSVQYGGITFDDFAADRSSVRPLVFQLERRLDPIYVVFDARINWITVLLGIFKPETVRNFICSWERSNRLLL